MITFKKTKDSITKSLDKIVKELEVVPKEAYDVFVANTPVASGNAKKKTRITGTVIEANYAYAKRLDEGWSRQSPRGMTQPTQEFLKKRLNSLMRK